MAQVGVTLRQALREVPQFVLAKQTDGTCQAHLDAQIYQGVLQPLRALKAIVDKLAVTAERVSKQQDYRG